MLFPLYICWVCAIIALPRDIYTGGPIRAPMTRPIRPDDLRALDLDPVQARLLIVLARHGPTSAPRLARLARCELGTVGRALDPLTGRGLVERRTETAGERGNRRGPHATVWRLTGDDLADWFYRLWVGRINAIDDAIGRLTEIAHRA